MFRSFRPPQLRRITATSLGVSLFSALLATVPQLIAPQAALAAPNTFVTVAKGTPDEASIALNVRMPTHYEPGHTYPTIFEMSGYDGGSAEGGTLAKDFGVPPQVPEVPREDSRQLTDPFADDYVTVHASVRGTGCSSGVFELWGWRTALDGKEIIDDWIAQQPWSNGDVGIVGHSYGGITGFMVAATQPTHLRGVSVSGLIDDLYRGIVYPGGVTNFGFPLLWNLGIRPFYDVGGGLAPGLIRPEQSDDDPQRQEKCANNEVAKQRLVGMVDPVAKGITDTDNAWYQQHSLINYAKRSVPGINVPGINVPTHIVGAYQDEQTGPRGPSHLYEALQGIPKRLILTNGDHNTETIAAWGSDPIEKDRKAWIDHWVRGVETPGISDGWGTRSENKKSVTTFFEMHREGTDENHQLTPNGRKDSADFPLPDTTWTKWYLHDDGKVSITPTSPLEKVRPYVTGTKRQFWNYQANQEGFDVAPINTAEGPDELDWKSAVFKTNTAIDGPITANLRAIITGEDTEFFVELIDQAPDGSHTYLQRGMLRAQDRAVDVAKSDKTAAGLIYRPYHPHTAAARQTVQRLKLYDYLVEIFPVGHVFRPGHRLVVKIHAPPFVDSYYAYPPRSAPGVNYIVPGSYLTLPMVPLTGVTLGPELGCGEQEAMRCVADPEGSGGSVPPDSSPVTVPILPDATVPETPSTLIPGGLLNQ